MRSLVVVVEEEDLSKRGGRTGCWITSIVKG
jgi:hypothetical protein